MNSLRFVSLFSILVVAKAGVSQVRFAKAVTYAPGGPSAVVADVNCDGHPDMVCSMQSYWRMVTELSRPQSTRTLAELLWRSLTQVYPYPDSTLRQSARLGLYGRPWTCQLQ